MRAGDGGDRVSEVMNAPSADIAFGGGIGLSIGAIIPLSTTTPYSFELQPSIGYQFRDKRSEGLNGVAFSSYPIELLYFLSNRQENFRVGYGLTYNVANRLKGQGANAGVDTEVKNALGSVFTIEKMFEREKSALGLRIVSIRYKADSFTREADGTSVFLTLSLFELPTTRRIFD